MKRFKFLTAGILVMCMLITGTGFAAEAVPCATGPLNMDCFERYPSHTYDSETGKWTVHFNEADALNEHLWNYGMETGNWLCAFYLELEGNALTGIRTPVLRFCYMNGRERINASAVSVLAGDTRYDFAATSSEVNIGRRTAEIISVPLTRDALEAVRAMVQCEELSVRLIGEEIFTFELEQGSTHSRNKLQTESLSGLNATLKILDAAGMSEYELWDLSADAWKSEYGFEPAYAKQKVTYELLDTTISDEFGMVTLNDQSKAARRAQELLIEYGFLSGSVSSRFTQAASDAARRAQHYLGMIETGCVDALLIETLEMPSESTAEEYAAMQTLGNTAEIALNRYWFAKAVSAAKSVDNMRSVMNTDNIFLALDGEICNISTNEIRLFMDIEAKLIYNDVYAYEATIVCERNEGCELDISMLPMAKARLLVYAEIPAYLAQDEAAAWSVELTAHGENLKFELQ